MLASSVLLCFPFRCVHIRSKTTYYQVNSEHNLHKDQRNKLCISLLRVAMDRLNDLLLLRRLHADGLERLPGAAVRADERFVVLSGKRRQLTVGLAAFGAYFFSYIILFHSLSFLSYQQAPVPGTFCQIENPYTLAGKF